MPNVAIEDDIAVTPLAICLFIVTVDVDMTARTLEKLKFVAIDATVVEAPETSCLPIDLNNEVVDATVVAVNDKRWNAACTKLDIEVDVMDTCFPILLTNDGIVTEVTMSDIT